MTAAVPPAMALGRTGALKILHVLDHSIALHSGYAFRTAAILQQQRALGWDTFHLTRAKHALACPA